MFKLNLIQVFILAILLLLVVIYGVLRVRTNVDDRRVVQRLKLLLVISFVWALNAFLISFEYNISTDNYLLFWAGNKMFSLLALGFALSSYYLVKVFPVKKVIGKSFKTIESIILLSAALMVPAILLTDHVGGAYIETANSSLPSGVVEINNNFVFRSGDASIIFGLFLALILLVTIRLSFTKKHEQKLTESEKSQTRIIVFGISLAVLLGVVFQLVLPSIIKDYPNSLYTLGQFAPIFMTFSAYYAVMRYKLFDIRSSAFRAVAYSLSVATLVGIYSILLYGAILPLVDPGARFQLSTFALLLLGTAATIFLFDKVKLIFDEITDKLFFKNSYSLPKFLDEFNQTLINSGDVGELAAGITRMITENLKTEFVVLIVKDGKFEVTIDSRLQHSKTEVEAKVSLSMINYHYKENTRVALREYLDKKKFSGLYDALEEEGCVVAVDLSESSKSKMSLTKALESGEFKTMLLGPKRSGDNYTLQDLDALRIISKEMVVALQNSMRFEEIKQFNLELQHKIDVATNKLKNQNVKLVMADQLKDDFLSIASHQMRTPISAINGYSSMLAAGDLGRLNKEQKKFAHVIEESSKKLSYLINDFLTVSRLKSGKFSIEKSRTNLRTILKDEVKDLEHQYKTKGVKLKVEIDESIHDIEADGSKLRQAMMNLIDNALYYTPAEGSVNVTLKKGSAGYLEFRVEDTGIGVPKEQQHNLFGKLFRADNAQKVRPDGTGLGLYLAKKVVLGHKGTIIFKSKEGEGSTFGFRIPTK